MPKTDSFAKSPDKGSVPAFPWLDRFISTLKAGTLCVIAGRPGTGKTALALSILARLGVVQDKPALLFSTEYPASFIGSRLLQGSLWDLSQPQAKFPLYVKYAHPLALSYIRRCSAELSAQDPGLALIALDFIQDLEDASGGQVPHAADPILKALKELAVELSVPVLALSSVKGEADRRQDHMPQLTDLIWSESAADADVVLAMERPALYYSKEPQPRDDVVKIRVLKGAEDVFAGTDLLFDRQSGTFDLASLQK